MTLIYLLKNQIGFSWDFYKAKTPDDGGNNQDVILEQIL